MDPGGPYSEAMTIGRVAQRIRRLTTNQKIVGSNPIVIIFVQSTSIKSELIRKFNAASRIRTYAGRSHLISSQTP